MRYLKNAEENKMKQGSQSKLSIAIIAGLIAITISTILLKAAPIFHIRVEGGGLLKLLLSIYGKVGIAPLVFHAPWFALLFRYLVGLSMVLIYVYLFNPLIPMLPGWLKGTIFSFFPWAIYGLIVLPMLGSKIFGYDQISLAGRIFFFLTDWTFGFFTGWLYERFVSVGRYQPRMRAIKDKA